MILDIIEQLGGWSWWVLGLVLLGVEVLLPGFFFLWFGIAAILIGISALLIDWPWQLQVVGFVVLSVIAGAHRPPFRRHEGRRHRRSRTSTSARAASRADLRPVRADRGRPRPHQDRRRRLAGARARCASRRAREGDRRRGHRAHRDQRLSARIALWDRPVAAPVFREFPNRRPPPAPGHRWSLVNEPLGIASVLPCIPKGGVQNVYARLFKMRMKKAE